MNTINFNSKITTFLSGQKSMADICRAIVNPTASVDGFEGVPSLEEKLVILEKALQEKWDNKKIDYAKIRSVNASLQRDTQKFSKELDENNVIKVGCKVNKKTNEVTVSLNDTTKQKDKDPLLVAVAKFKAERTIDNASEVTRIMLAMIDEKEKAELSEITE